MRAGELCIHELPHGQCSYCGARSKYGAGVWVTAGGLAFNAQPDCGFLEAGQRSVEASGGVAAPRESVGWGRRSPTGASRAFTVAKTRHPADLRVRPRDLSGVLRQSRHSVGISPG